MNEGNYIIEKRHKKGKLYRNKLRKIFKEEVILCQYNEIALTGGVYFQVIIGDKIYLRSYTPIEKVKFKDMLKFIYETYWYDIFEKYFNLEEITKYLPIREKRENK